MTAQDTALTAAWILVFVVLALSPTAVWTAPGPPAEVLVCLPLLLRRRYPLAAALAVGALLLLYSLFLGFVNFLLLVLVAFAAGSAAFHGSRMLVLAPLSVGWFLLFFHVVTLDQELHDEPLGRSVMLGVMGALPAFVGYLLRLRAERTEQRLRMTRARAQQERARERARIARDVHDIAGHHLSAIRLLSAGGRESLKGPDADPDAVLAAIGEASGRAVREVRGLLEQLRDARLDEPAPSDVRLDDLPQLVSALDGTGVDVDLVVPDGAGDGVSARVAVDVYRIVQEALGNALRHSSARHVIVQLSRHKGAKGGTGQLVVAVEDDGSPLPEGEVPESTGMGLRGMRERAEELGGSLEAGFGRGGRGWRVRASLPVDAEPGEAGEGGSRPVETSTTHH